MLFNSLEYFLFLPLVFLLYYSLPGKYRWALLLACSYYFYMCWEVNYIFLIFTSTLIDYFSAIKIEQASSKSAKKSWMFLSIASNLGILFFFKYFNFFTDTIELSLGVFNIKTAFPDFDILLPVGISFYTFQSLSYTIDVYKGESKAERHFGYFALFVSYFPQLVAGPIEKASRLIPKLKEVNPFNYDLAVSGTKLIALGLFKKTVIADRLSPYVAMVFDHPNDYQGIPVIVASVFFAFQIYCDFSGYTDIAIGSSRLLGKNLIKNFNLPYLSASFTEFWKRWHISLSSWFRDYVYIPLGGNKVSSSRHYINLFITFLVSGLWHGANFTFIFWGAMHGALVAAESLFSKFKIQINFSFLKPLKIALVFAVVLIGWVFFRAASIDDALLILKQASHIEMQQIGIYMFDASICRVEELYLSIVFISLLMIFEIAQYRMQNIGKAISQIPFALRWGFYIAIVFTIMFVGIFEKDQFIYFQF
jgi:alginate O-acetyltransferase complex protein AlgI